jgi:DNA-binding transcriptional LysR family regulator
MTLEQLRVFLCVAEYLNMTRAADSLGLSQPAVSAAIGALEGRYATQLFNRVGRRIELTEAGRLFLPEAKAVVARSEDARAVLDDLAGLKRGGVRIASSQTVATYWLPPRMARFALHAPGINLHLAVGNSAQAAAALLSGEADIGFVETEVDEPLLSRKVIGSDRIAFYASPNHPLVGRPLKAKDLMGAIWIMREQGSGTRDHVSAQLEHSGIRSDALKIALELPSNGAVLEAVEGGQLVGAVSELAGTARVKAGYLQALRWSLPARDFTMLLHKERHRSRATTAFIASFVSKLPRAD